MELTLPGILTVASFVQPEKVSFSIFLRPPGNDTVVRLLQFKKALAPIVLTLPGILMLVRPDCSKAPDPIDLTFLGIDIFARAIQL